MITDQLTNTIYFSHMLEQVCPDFYRSISTLKEKGYPIEFFQGAKDMWARDYNADTGRSRQVRGIQISPRLSS